MRVSDVFERSMEKVRKPAIDIEQSQEVIRERCGEISRSAEGKFKYATGEDGAKAYCVSTL